MSQPDHSPADTPPISLVPVAFEWSTGNVHIDKAIESAAASAVIGIKNQLAASMANMMKRELEVLSKYPPPTPGTILNRGTCVDKVCQCGRVVTFPLTEAKPQAQPRPV